MTSQPLAREFFAVTNQHAYLNHAAVGVLPVPVRDALHRFIDAHASGGVLGTFPYEAQMREYRERIGRFIGAPGSQIAVLRNTSDGANVIAAGFPWREGDEVILPDNEFPANVYAWLRLRDRGVAVRLLPSQRQRMTPEVLRQAIGPRTKMVAVSWVAFEDGYRHDLAGLAEVSHAAGSAIVVDAIQGLGALPLDVQACGIDALYCGGAKWMLALQGVSFLYVNPTLQDRLAVASPGWRSVENIWDFLDYDQHFAPDASRFEGGTPNFIGALSLAKAIEVLQNAGLTKIERHVLDLTDALVEGLQVAGARISSIRSPGTSSGIVTFTVPGVDCVALGKALQGRHIVTTYRNSGVRVAPHGYNTAGEIDALIAAVRSYKKEEACSL